MKRLISKRGIVFVLTLAMLMTTMVVPVSASEAGEPGFVQTERILVTFGNFDEMADVLEILNLQYDYLLPDDLDLIRGDDTEKVYNFMKGYDVIFINCDNWDRHVNNDAMLKYVEEGGLIFFSDLSFVDVIAAFPDYFTLDTQASQFVNATVMHPGLRMTLGVDNFDVQMIEYAPADDISDIPDDVTVYLAAERYTQVATVTSLRNTPVIFSIPHGEGTVFYSALHHHYGGTNEYITPLFAYIVFELTADNNRRLVGDAVEDVNDEFDKEFNYTEDISGMIGGGDSIEFDLTDFDDGEDFAVINGSDFPDDFQLTLISPDGDEYTNYDEGFIPRGEDAAFTATQTSLDGDDETGSGLEVLSFSTFSATTSTISKLTGVSSLEIALLSDGPE